MFTNTKCYAAILLDADFMMLKAEKRVEFHQAQEVDDRMFSLDLGLRSWSSIVDEYEGMKGEIEKGKIQQWKINWKDYDHVGQQPCSVCCDKPEDSLQTFALCLQVCSFYDCCAQAKLFQWLPLLD